MQDIVAQYVYTFIRKERRKGKSEKIEGKRKRDACVKPSSMSLIPKMHK